MQESPITPSRLSATPEGLVNPGCRTTKKTHAEMRVCMNCPQHATTTHVPNLSPQPTALHVLRAPYPPVSEIDEWPTSADKSPRSPQTLSTAPNRPLGLTPWRSFITRSFFRPRTLKPACYSPTALTCVTSCRQTLKPSFKTLTTAALTWPTAQPTHTCTHVPHFDAPYQQPLGCVRCAFRPNNRIPHPR